MSPVAVAVTGTVILLALLALRVPVAFSMFLVGFVGVWMLNGLNAATGLLASESFTIASNPELIVVPLFILMGNVASITGMSRRLYEAAYALIGQIRGGLAVATLIGCGGFAALSGSSVASALTMGKVSLAEMDRFRYDPKLSTGVVAAGGTLGILIPPSTGFVIYAVLSEQSIGRLFLAGVIPGILLLLMFMATVFLLCSLRPGMGPRGPSTTLAEKSRAIFAALPIIILTLLTIGGIYGGFFSPSEAAGVGAEAVIAYGLVTGTLTLRELWGATRDSIVTSSAVMLILIAAHIFNPFLALSHIPELVSNAIGAMDLGRIGTLLVILVIYMALGTFLEGFAMLVLTPADLRADRQRAGDRPDLVRSAGSADAGNGADLAAGRDQRLHRQVGGAQGAAGRHLPRGVPVLAGDAGDAADPGRGAGAVAVSADNDDAVALR